MVVYEVLDPPSPHKHTNSITIHGRIPFVINPESKWNASAPWVNMKPDSLKPAGRFRTPSQSMPLAQGYMIRKKPLNSQLLLGGGKRLAWHPNIF